MSDAESDHRIAALERELAQLRAENAQLQARVRALESNSGVDQSASSASASAVEFRSKRRDALIALLARFDLPALSPPTSAGVASASALSAPLANGFHNHTQDSAARAPQPQAAPSTTPLLSMFETPTAVISSTPTTPSTTTSATLSPSAPTRGGGGSGGGGHGRKMSAAALELLAAMGMDDSSASPSPPAQSSSNDSLTAKSDDLKALAVDATTTTTTTTAAAESQPPLAADSLDLEAALDSIVGMGSSSSDTSTKQTTPLSPSSSSSSSSSASSSSRYTDPAMSADSTNVTTTTTNNSSSTDDAPIARPTRRSGKTQRQRGSSGNVTFMLDTPSTTASLPQDFFFSPHHFKLSHHLDGVRALVFVPSTTPSLLVSASEDATVLVWELPDNRTTVLPSLTHSASMSSSIGRAGGTHKRLSSKSSSATALTSPTTSSLPSASSSSASSSSSSASARLPTDPLACLRSHRDAVLCLCTNNEGDTVVSGGRDGLVVAWNILSVLKQNSLCTPGSYSASHMRARNATTHTDAVWAVASLPGDESRFVTACADGHVRVWNLRDPPQSVFSLPPADDTPSSLCAVSESRCFIGTRRGAVILFDLTTNQPVSTTSTAAAAATTPSSSSSSSSSSTLAAVFRLAFISRHQLVAAALGGGDIAFFNALTGQLVHRFRAHPAAVSSLTCIDDANTLVSCAHDSELRYWLLDPLTSAFSASTTTTTTTTTSSHEPSSSSPTTTTTTDDASTTTPSTSSLPSSSSSSSSSLPSPSMLAAKKTQHRNKYGESVHDLALRPQTRGGEVVMVLASGGADGMIELRSTPQQ